MKFYFSLCFYLSCTHLKNCFSQKLACLFFFCLVVVFLNLCILVHFSNAFSSERERLPFWVLLPIIIFEEDDYYRITEWFDLEGILKTVEFQIHCCGQGQLPLVQVAEVPIQPGFEHFQEWVIHSLAGHLFWCLTILIVKKSFLVPGLNLP